MSHDDRVPSGRSRGRDGAKRLIRIVAPAAFWLGLWWFLAIIVNQELFIPSPPAVFKKLVELMSTSLFWVHTGYTLLRILIGTALGVLAGAALAAVTFASRAANALLSPAVRVVRTAPVASFIILVLLWVSTSRVPAVICGLMVLPVVWESVTAGLNAPGRELLEMAEAYKMGPWRRVRYIYLPYLAPHLRSGVLNSIGLAWKSGVAAEVLCVPRRAVGSQVYYSKLYMDTPALFAWTAVVVALSLVLEAAVRRLLMREAPDNEL